MRVFYMLALLAAAVALVGCANTPPSGMKPVALVPQVDLSRFMGDWYVIANIPTFLEKGANNPKDSYRLNADGSIATTFSFNADSPDGDKKSYHSTGFVLDAPINAVWGQQYVWPIKADYRISYLAPDYSATIVAREKRDYVWIMARTPHLPEAELQRLIEIVGTLGYDTSKLQRPPQKN